MSATFAHSALVWCIRLATAKIPPSSFSPVAPEPGLRTSHSAIMSSILYLAASSLIWSKVIVPRRAFSNSSWLASLIRAIWSAISKSSSPSAMAGKLMPFVHSPPVASANAATSSSVAGRMIVVVPTFWIGSSGNGGRTASSALRTRPLAAFATPTTISSRPATWTTLGSSTAATCDGPSICSATVASCSATSSGATCCGSGSANKSWRN